MRHKLTRRRLSAPLDLSRRDKKIEEGKTMTMKRVKTYRGLERLLKNRAMAGFDTPATYCGWGDDIPERTKTLRDWFSQGGNHVRYDPDDGVLTIQWWAGHTELSGCPA